MTAETSTQLARRLRRAGLSNSAIRAAWPTWWSAEADSSASARLELRFAVARNLGLEPASLFEGAGEPRFVWKGDALFKRLAVGDEIERDAIASFGKALGGLLTAASPTPTESVAGIAAVRLRETILSSAETPYVQLADLLALCWGLGIPVAHLQVFPGDQKGMAAMTVFVRDSPVILLSKDSKFPGQMAFYLAHEIGHIGLRHVGSGAVLVDMDDTPAPDNADADEVAADAFALELLTGESRPTVLSATGHASGTELARVAILSATDLGIEPGTLALCFAYSTGHWGTAMGAMKHIYPDATPLWQTINQVAMTQLLLERLPDDSRQYLLAALGLRDR